jgi:hypothetical protein
MNDQSIINRISGNKINLSDIENLIDEYYEKDKYLIKFFLLRFPKETCNIIVKYIIDNDDINFVEYVLSFHHFKICDIHYLNKICIQYEICLNKCKCESTLYWNYLYKEMMRISLLTPRLLIKNEGLERNLSKLIFMTDVYDNKVEKLVKELFNLGYINFIIDFIYKNKLFSDFYYKILLDIEENVYENKIDINHDSLIQTLDKMNNIRSRYIHLTKHIIITDLKGTSNICILNSLKVKYIVSLTKKKFFRSSFIKYIRIPIEDNNNEKFIDNCLDIAIDIVDKIKNKQTVLIHCVMGLSRSICFSILVLMLLGNDFKKSYEFIKNKKTINPNPKFLEELQNFKI